MIGDRLKEARKLAGLSQAQVAKMLGLRQQFVSDTEADNRRVSIDELARLARIYNVKVGWLLGETPDNLDAQDPRVELAALELTKLNQDDLDRLLALLAAMRRGSASYSEGGTLQLSMGNHSLWQGTRPMTSADLLEWQKRLGLTQAEAAMALGIPFWTYRTYVSISIANRRRLPQWLPRMCWYIETHGPLP